MDGWGVVRTCVELHLVQGSQRWQPMKKGAWQLI